MAEDSRPCPQCGADVALGLLVCPSCRALMPEESGEGSAAPIAPERAPPPPMARIPGPTRARARAPVRRDPGAAANPFENEL